MSIDRAYETMMDVFRRQNADGTYFFTDAEVQHFLPWMIMRVSVDLDTLDEGALTNFARACGEAGVQGGMAPEEVEARFAAYYQAKPLHPELVRAFEAAFRDVQAAGSDAAPGAFGKMTGAATNRTVLDGGKRPEGTIPAGPMARFQVKPK
jgi:hypothetical protein